MLWLTPGAAADPPGDNPEAIAGWTPEKIIAAQAWREERLGNFTVSYTETLWVLASDGSSKLHHREDFLMRFTPGRIWFQFSNDQPNVPELSFKDCVQNWDGTEAKSLLRLDIPKPGEQFSAAIRDVEPNPLRTSGFLTVIGYRYYLEKDHLSVFLRKMLSKPAEYTESVTEGVDGGDKCVTLRVVELDGSDTWEYTFLPDKDFVLRRRVQKYPLRGGGFEVNTIDVHHISQMDGFWMPEESTILGHGSDIENKIECVLHSVSFKEPSDDDMKITIPPETLVNDRLKNQMYMLRADGTKEQLRFLDAATGKVIEPTTAPAN